MLRGIVKCEDLVVLTNNMTSVTVPVVNQWSVHIAQVLCANLSATLTMIVHDCKCVLTGSLLRTHFRNEE